MISYPIITRFTYSEINPGNNLFLLIILLLGNMKVNNIPQLYSFNKYIVLY